jgi:hypothetical protein
MADPIQTEGPKIVAWFAHRVPLWALGVAFLVGAVASRLA